MIPHDAKPHEVAVLIVYSLGYKSPTEIAQILHYQTRDTAWRVLKKYRSHLPELRVAHKQRLIGKSFYHRSP